MFTKKRDIRDVYLSSLDVRFERSFLSKKGNARTIWWNLNNLIQRFIYPSSNLEERMYRFHSRHQRWTLSRLERTAGLGRSTQQQVPSAVLMIINHSMVLSKRPISKDARKKGHL